ncbi:MAG: protein-tyrosine-phosphatase [Bacteroidota bacterium]
MKVLPRLALLIERLESESHLIPNHRKELLQSLAAHLEGQGSCRLIFICTHNSRRSHLAMIWAAVGASFYGLPQVATFSGGTEITAMNPRIAYALKQAGFEVDLSSESHAQNNPTYLVTYREDRAPLHCFSKKYNHPDNPKDDFAAIMVCSSADRDCPLVPGASYRLALPYEDPKVADGLPAEVQTYQSRLEEIGREILFVFKLAAEGKY